MSDTSFAIDFQEKFTRVCDTKQTAGKVELTTLSVVETAPSYFSNDTPQTIERQAQLVQQLVKVMPSKKKIVDIILPDSYTYSQIIEMPQLKERELLSAIRYQSDEFIPMSIDDTNLDIEILREDPVNKKYLVLIVAAPKKIVAQIEKTLDLVGLVPGNLTNELSVVGRLYSEKLFKAKKAAATLVLNFGYNTSSLYLIDGQSGLVVMTRTFKVGVDLFLRGIKVNLNIDDKKAGEFLKTIGFSKSGSYDIENIILPIAKELTTEMQKFAAAARERLNVPVDLVHTFNYDNSIGFFDKKLTELLSIPTFPLPIKDIILPNPIYQSAANDITSFVSVIAGTL